MGMVANCSWVHCSVGVCTNIYLTITKLRSMKKVFILTLFALVLFSCENQKKSKKETVVQSAPVLKVLSVDDLLTQAAELADKEIVVKGTVMHVCTHSGKRCFIMGSNEDMTIRIEAGDKIGSFSQELMGSDIEITGVLREVKTDAQAHKPGEHKGEHKEDEASEKAHKVITDSNEKAKTVYFIEGIKSEKL